MIGVDLGTNCGWSVVYRGRRMRSGTWRLAEGTDAGHHVRFTGLFLGLMHLVRDCKLRYKTIPALCYERVDWSTSVKQSQLYGGWLGVVSVVRHISDAGEARANPITTYDPTPSQWKREIVGHGNANKEDYVAFVNKKYDLELSVSDNEDEAAAICLGLYGWKASRE